MKGRVQRIHQIESIYNSQPDDLLIACADFQSRCRWSTRVLSECYSTKNAICLWYDEAYLRARRLKNKRVITEKMREVSYNAPVDVRLPLKNPIEGIKRVQEVLKERNILLSNARITIDVTSLAKIHLFTILRYLDNLKSGNIIRTIYTSPKLFGIHKGYPITKGLDKIQCIPSFGGIPSRRKDNLLILFLGFEGNRALAVYDKIGPHKAIAVIGYPPQEPGWDKDSEQLNHELISHQHVGIEKASMKNPFLVQKFLEHHYGKLSEKYNFYIVPMGSKFQAVGIYLFVRNHQEVQIVYFTPATTPKGVNGIGQRGYGSGKTWECVLPRFP